MKEGKVFILLIDLKTMKIFRMYFNTEFERDKFRRRLRYSKKLVELEVDDELAYYDCSEDYYKLKYE